MQAGKTFGIFVNAVAANELPECELLSFDWADDFIFGRLHAIDLRQTEKFLEFC